MCSEAVAARTGLGLLLLKGGQSAEAERLLRACVVATRKSPGPRHPDTLTTQANLASALKRWGFGEAETSLRETLETRRQVIGPEHPSTLSTVRALAENLAARHRPDEAEALSLLPRNPAAHARARSFRTRRPKSN